MYFCEDCKLIIEDEDADIEENDVGFAYGRPAIETYPICPNCGEPVSEYHGEEGKKYYSRLACAFGGFGGLRNE